MIKRKLGQGLEVSALSLGAMGYGKSRDIPDRAEMIDLLRAAVDRGMDFFDTAEAYGPFTNEEMVGEALAPVRHRVKIATKFGWDIDPDTGVHHGRRQQQTQSYQKGRRRKPQAAPDGLHRCSLPASCGSRSADGRCCRNRQAPDRGRQGPLFGLSEVGAQSIRRAHAVQPVAALQSEYSLWTREPEAEIIPTIEELGIGLVPYSPLGKGFLTGKIHEKTAFSNLDLRGRIPRFSPEAIQKNRRLVDLLATIGQRHGATPAQVGLAWLLAQKPWIVPLFGTRKLERLEENLGALSVTLTTDDLGEIEAANIKIEGARYPEEILRRSGL
jgi:aryl-alcohol dehydrogenase-like predicted oxidoreductase